MKQDPATPQQIARPRTGLEPYVNPHTGGRIVSSLCNSCRSIAPKLNKTIDKSYNAGREMSVSWCVTPLEDKEHMALNKPLVPYESNKRSGITKTSDTTIGDESSVVSPDIRCEDGQVSANFHTHPNGAINLSAADYTATFLKGESILCLGTRNVFNDPLIYCDIVDKNNEYYREIREEIVHIGRTLCHPRANAFRNAVEGGKPLKEIEDARSLYKESHADMMETINNAIEKGVIRRCSLASNISRTQQ